MATLTRDGIALHYEVASGSAQSYLFVHGWTCNRRHFAPQAKHFIAKGHTVVSVDLRGHGASTVPEGTSITIADFTADLAAVIDAAGLDKPIAVGHSMGGLTVLNLAAEHGDRLGGIVMVDPAPMELSEELAQLLDDVVGAMKAGDQTQQGAFISERLFLPTDDADEKQRVRAEMLATPVHVAIAAMASIRAFDGAGVASRCRVPAMHIAAAVPLTPHARMEGMLEGVVSAQTVGAGHFNQLLVPVQVNDMVEQFARLHVWP